MSSYESLSGSMGAPLEEKGAPMEQERELRYMTEAGPVDLQWEAFSPEVMVGEGAEGVVSGEDEAVIYLPGAALEARSGSVRDLTQQYAKHAHTKAFAISTRIEDPNVAESQFPQAEAVRQFIEQKGLKKITIVGHSQGGNKAIDLVFRLQQESPGVAVDGLVLIGSGGLYDQKPTDMLRNFFKDAQISTPPNVVKTLVTDPKRSFVRKAVQAGFDVSKGIVKEGMRAPREFVRRVKLEAEDAGKRNQRAEELRVPIVLVQGAMDPVSSYREILPEGSENQSVASQEARGEALRRDLFKKSPNVKVLLAERGGHHGVQYFRPDAVAKTSLYMLERMQRGEKAAS